MANDALSGAGTGAAAGATIGSAVPVIGTAVGAVGGALIGGTIGAIKANRRKKAAERLLNANPKYTINDEAYDNQAIAKSRAFGRDRSIQMQETQLDQDASNAANQATNVTDSTSGLLSTIAAINASKGTAQRGLAQDQAAIQSQNIGQLYNANNAMIDEKDKAWNYNSNMPWQMKVAMMRDREKYSQEQNANMFGTAANFAGQYFGAKGG